MRAPLLAPLLAAALADAPAAQRAFEVELGGDAAHVLVHAAEPAAAEAAAEAAFDALRRLGDEDLGRACDAAVAAARAAGAPAVAVGWRGVTALGEAPPDGPGWMVPVGFGTPGYPLLRLPLAEAAVARSVVAGDPVKLAVLAPDAARAVELAATVRRLGRRGGRAAVAASGGARLFLEDARYRPLFDGRSLDGWTTTGGRYDGAAVWEASGGAIVGRTGPEGEGGLLYTEEELTSYALELEVALDHPFDSGVFVHMVPRERGLKGVQVTLDDRPGGEIGALYADGYLTHEREAKARWRRDAWNHLELRVTGFETRVEAWLEGVKVADHRLPPGSSDFAAAGRIGLQVHGGEPGAQRARFRNVRVRELPVFATVRDEEGWEDLLADPGLAAWERHGAAEGWHVEDGVLAAPPRGDGYLATRADHRDLRLRLDFELARMANSGVFLRAARDGSNPAFSGCEVQILDERAWEAVAGAELRPWQLTGSLYGAVPAGTRRLHPPGEWNALEVLYRGSRLAVALNGRLLYDVDVLALEPASGPPFAERAAAGFVGLQAHSPDAVEGDGSVRFRDLAVQRL